jgi:hypothetical protein
MTSDNTLDLAISIVFNEGQTDSDKIKDLEELFRMKGWVMD